MIAYPVYVFKWYKRFQDGRDALEDDPKPDRRKNKNRDELVEKVREMIDSKGIIFREFVPQG